MNQNFPLIARDHYLQRLIAAKDRPFIKVLTGIRRSGKSSIMKMMMNDILDSGVSPDHVIYIDFDIDSPDTPHDHRGLTDYVSSRVPVGPGTYIFLDEIQNVSGWEASASSFYASGADVYITGSNSRLLSSELATRLSGRCIEICVRPLVFSEYLEFRKSGLSIEAAFDDFFHDGGFPSVALSEDTEAKRLIPEILSGIYSTVFVKDVIERCQVRNPAGMANLTRFLLRNIGDRTSSRNVSNYLVSSGQKISHVTIEEYLQYLSEAYLFSRSERIDVKTKEYLRTTDKFYCSDIGIRNNQVVLRPEDLDGILENIVYNELLFRYSEVAVCAVGSLEVDFVADPNGTPSYYQVSMSIADADTRERELSSLRKIAGSYPKYILTYDCYPVKDIEGIRIVRVVDWLLGRTE